MGKIGIPKNVKLFAGLIGSTTELIEDAEAKLSEKWGTVDFRTAQIPFIFTQYYNKEMGETLFRRWISFEELVPPGELAEIKVMTNNIEEQFALNKKRRVNIDPGYITLANVILASSKDFSHRIYLAQGIYGEVTLLYKDKKFIPLPWTYPDYQSPEAMIYFDEVRKKYHKQLTL